MPENSVERVVVVTSSVNPLGEGHTFVVLTHVDHPGWEFVLFFGSDGGLGSFNLRPPHAPIDDPGQSPHRFELLVGRGLLPQIGEGSRTVTRRLLRDVPLGELEVVARAHLALRAGSGRPSARLVTAAPELEEAARRWSAWGATQPRRTGRAGRGDRYYAELARQYVGILRDPDRARRVNEELAAMFNLDKQTVTNQLYEARHSRGLLTPTTKGRAGGELTPKAIKILEQEEI